MTLEMVLVIASVLLQFAFIIVGVLVWHEFRRLQHKVDGLSTHQVGCHQIFASRDSVKRLFEKCDAYDSRFAAIEGRVSTIEGGQ